MTPSAEKILTAAYKARANVSDLQRIAFDWRMSWLTKAHAHQIEPEGDWWTIWLLLAGRGAGKTRTAAEWIASEAWDDPGSRSLVAAPTSGDIRDICFEGESGLLSVIPPALIRDYNRSLSEIVLVNGSLIKGISASEPSRFRGPQWHRVWCEEFASWDRDEEALDMIMFSMRLGVRPKMVMTTTPKPKTTIRSLVARNGKDVVLVTATTMSNMENLAPTFRAQIMQYEGTQLFRQEALAELIDPEESGIIKRSWFRLWPAKKPLPAFDFIVMSLDTAFTEKTVDRKNHDPDFTACTVWGGFKMEEPGGPKSLDDLPELEDDKPQGRAAPRRGDATVKSYVMVLDVWEERLGLPDLIKRVKRELNVAYGDDHDSALIKPKFGSAKPRTSGHKVDMVLIENTGAGISLRQTLDEEGVATFPYNPGRADKLTRLHLTAPHVVRRQVWLPESERHAGRVKTWVEPLLHQICSFAGEGSIKHDDLVDSFTQSLRFFADKGFLKNDASDSLPPPAKRRGNPYDR